MQKMKAAGLVLDFDLYPRNNVDSFNVRSIVEALSSGVHIPPVIIDKKSKRVIDGFHRTRAVLRLFGEEATIDVIAKSYRTEAEMFLDAVRYNASHGAKLDQCDRTHCLLVAERLSIPMEAVAGALNIPPDRLGNLRETRTAKAGGLMIPLKRSLRHMAGRRLTKEQAAVNQRSSGMNQQFYANQLIDLIQSGLLDQSDEQLIERLRVLNDLLDTLLAGAVE